jgi:hypothetical protein
MDYNVKKWWLELSEATLRTRLFKQHKGMNPTLIANIVAHVQELKAERRKERIKSTVTNKTWEPLLSSARAERQTVFVMKSQLKKIQPLDQRKWDALCAYEAVITTVIEKLAALQKAGDSTPKSFVATLKQERGVTIPNEGTHWVDYVKASDRNRIAALFDGLPPPARGKTKTPFLRRISKAVHKEQRLALIKRLNGEIASAEREYEVTDDPDTHDKLNRQLDAMHRAQYELDRLPATAPLPATWHGLLNK